MLHNMCKFLEMCYRENMEGFMAWKVEQLARVKALENDNTPSEDERLKNLFHRLEARLEDFMSRFYQSNVTHPMQQEVQVTH